MLLVPAIRSGGPEALAAAARAPSAGFSQGFSFLVLEGAEQCAPWPLVTGLTFQWLEGAQSWP
jgi:hypothetical protein